MTYITVALRTNVPSYMLFLKIRQTIMFPGTEPVYFLQMAPKDRKRCFSVREAAELEKCFSKQTPVHKKKPHTVS